MRAGSRRVLASLVAIFIALANAAAAPAPPVAIPAEPQGPPALGLLLRRLTHLGTILFITAHPDDENNAVLVALARGSGARTALLTATRGEGGQNEIGPEIGEALGILRAGELEAIHRRDGVEQYFGRAYDFGFSFSVEESFEKWGRREILEDFVRVIRAVRPEVIVTLRREARGGGQHHQAAARLAVDAFRAAGDAKAFPPEITGGLEPWQARKIYEGATGIGPADENGLRIETAIEDSLLGATWFDFGARLRTLHRTQGMRLSDPARGTRFSYRLIDSEPPAAPTAEASFFDGIEISWVRLRELATGDERARTAMEAAAPRLSDDLTAARKAFEAEGPAATLPHLRSALAALRRLREEALVAPWSPRVRVDVLSRLDPKETDLMEAIALAHGLTLTASAEDAEVVPGQTFAVEATVASDGAEAVKVQDVVIHAPDGWVSERAAGDVGTLAKGTLKLQHRVTVGARAQPTRPYGRAHETLDRYEIPADARAGVLFPPTPVWARLFFTSGGLLVSLDRPVARREDAGEGPRLHTVSVVPPLSVRFASPVRIVPEGVKSASVELYVTHHGRGAARAVCRIENRDGWTVAPATARLRFTGEDEQQTVRFELKPPRDASSLGAVPLTASVAFENVREPGLSEEFHLVGYPHVGPRRWPRDARITARTVDVRVEAGRVGYVMGVGDRVPAALQQIGVRVTPLSVQDITSGDLSRYDTIVAGLRAYLARPELKQHHARMLEYVQRGGHLVVQYNRLEFNDPTPFAPYSAKVTAERITDETAPVKRLDPAHVLFNVPNRIGDADFEGWVQERGLAFLEAGDPRYEDLLASADPFPENAGEKKGMLVSTRVGSGRWTYVGLALWRQLQAGVPGSYRLLANLVSQPRARGSASR